MDSKTKVLLVVHDLSLTGAPRVIYDIFASLTSFVDLRTLAPKSGPLERKFRDLGPLDFIESDAPNLMARVRRKLDKKQLESTLQTWAPEVVYVNSVASLPMFNWLNIPSAPTILHVHELHSLVYEYLESNNERFLNLPRRYVGVSDSVCELLKEGLKIAPDRITRIYECIPDNFGSGVKSGNSDPDKPFTVGGVGVPSLRKGVTLWLQMADRLRELTSKPLRFVWVGMNQTHEGRMFREMARRCNLDVEFISVTPTPEPHYADFDVFAMTSWEDPCPLVVLENMALGKPVLCFTGSGGAPEEIGDTGIAIERFSPTAMAQAIYHLMENTQERLALGQAAQKRVRENFAVSVQAPKIYREIKALTQ